MITSTARPLAGFIGSRALDYESGAHANVATSG